MRAVELRADLRESSVVSLFDLLVLLLLVLSGSIGWLRGGVKEVITLFAIGGGFVAFALLGPHLAGAGGGLAMQALILVLVFAGGFSVVSLAGTLAARRITTRLPLEVDQATGSLIGAIRGWILAAFVLFTIEIYHIDAAKPAMVQGSLLAPALHVTAIGLGAPQE
ncbi:MAG: CvpA family protein [Pseudomonadota bacterium]